MQLSKELADQWWRDRRPGGIYVNQPDVSDPDWDRAIAVDVFFTTCSQDPDKLALVLSLLAETASTDTELAYIGTVHLENAYFSPLGERALLILQHSGLNARQRELILSGFQR